MKHIVFLLHGIGTQKSGWSHEAVENLKAKATAAFQKFGLTPVLEVEFVELFYADLLDKNMETMLEGGISLGDANDFLLQGFRERKDPNHVPNSNNEKLAAFVRDFALDVACYMWNAEFKQLILSSLADKMLLKIEQNPGKQYSFISHSLGTKVGFDLLHLFYQGNKYFTVNQFKSPVPPAPFFTGYYQLASVAFLLSQLTNSPEKPNDSHVRVMDDNQTPEQAGIILKKFGIYKNDFDPVAIIGRSNQIRPGVFSGIRRLSYLSQANMHDFNLYVDHPAVHLDMIEDFYGVVVPESKRMEAIQEYESSPQSVVPDIKEIINELSIILNDQVDVGNIFKLVAKLKALYEKIKQMGQ